MSEISDDEVVLELISSILFRYKCGKINAREAREKIEAVIKVWKE